MKNIYWNKLAPVFFKIISLATLYIYMLNNRMISMFYYKENYYNFHSTSIEKKSI